MSFEVFKGRDGKDTDSQGIPWNEQFEKRVERRLLFERWIVDHSDEPQTPQTPIPKPTNIEVVNTTNPASITNFISRKRKRTPPPAA